MLACFTGAHDHSSERQTRRHEPDRVRRLRQLVAKHHRHHQQHGRTRGRASRQADGPEYMRPVQ